jgi:hypothetical protein
LIVSLPVQGMAAAINITCTMAHASAPPSFRLQVSMVATSRSAAHIPRLLSPDGFHPGSSVRPADDRQVLCAARASVVFRSQQRAGPERVPIDIDHRS